MTMAVLRFRVFVTLWESTHDHGSGANADHRLRENVPHCTSALHHLTSPLTSEGIPTLYTVCNPQI